MVSPLQWAEMGDQRMLKLFGLGLGLSIGAGLTYLLINDERVQLIALVLGIIAFVTVFWGAPMMWFMARITKGPNSVTYHAGNHRASTQFPNYPQQQALPPPGYDNWQYGQVVETPQVEPGNRGEVIG